MNDKLEKNFLTASEISQYFIIPLNTIYRLSKNGKIKGIRIGKQWRYSREDIERLISGGISPRTLPARRNLDFTERRQYPRINCNLNCRYKVYIPSLKEFQFITGNIRNISGGGVLLYDNPKNLINISIDDPIAFEFELTSGHDLQKINTIGRVVRTSENGVGIKFRNIDKNYQNEIINYVD